MSGDLNNPIFHDAEKAREWLETRLWPKGPICPKCGTVDEATLMKGKSHRPGLYQCNSCYEPFTVTVGTLYERSHIPLNKWLAATHLMMASKKGISALQVGRMLGISKKSAWFLCHRIRESLRETSVEPMGGNGKIVEADETYVGGLEKNKHMNKRSNRGPGPVAKEAVFALVERGGRVRSTHVHSVNAETLRPIMNQQLHADTHLMTDEAAVYKKLGKEFAQHGSVRHRIGEYVRGNDHTNTIENYFSVFKKGLKGVYQHCGPQHLKRYLAEFDYRYNEREGLGVSDFQRMEKSIPGIVGKRLTYRRSDEASVI